MCVRALAGEDWGGAAADDQGPARGAASGGGSPGPAQEAPAEPDAEGERGAEGRYWKAPRLTPATRCLFISPEICCVICCSGGGGGGVAGL